MSEVGHLVAHRVPPLECFTASNADELVNAPCLQPCAVPTTWRPFHGRPVLETASCQSMVFTFSKLASSLQMIRPKAVVDRAALIMVVESTPWQN